MKRTAILLLSASFVITCLLFSCVPQKKAATAKNELIRLDSQLVQHNDNLKKLDQKRQLKDEQNEIDSAANSRIKKFIDKTGAEIDTMRNENTVIIRGTEIRKSDWELLRTILSKTRISEQRINQKLSFLEDLINRNMVVKLDQDVLFEPGSYKVSAAVVNKITSLFEPAATEIDRFTKKYPDFPLTLVITAKGYADATTISEGSSLYQELKSQLSLLGTEPDSRELNKQLSRARAKAVKELFEKFAATRSDNGIYLRNVVYLYEGKGEAFPDPKVKDYAINDPRRRIVLLFWSIFPD